jgi:uncharacterized protein (UPF0332 family)
LKQKDGLRRKKPSKKLCDEFMEKSRDDLAAADLMRKNNHLEWFVIINYYAMYHAALALLALAGYESKNHTCTRIALEEIFVKHSNSIEVIEWLDSSYSLQEDILKALSQAKDLREQVQYEISDVLPSIANNEHETAVQLIQDITKLVNKIKNNF